MKTDYRTSKEGQRRMDFWNRG